MPDVFISYKRERRSAAEHLARILSLHGFDVWFDYALVKGKDFAQQIDAQIRASKVLLVLWCKRSVTSSWVLEEADLASKLGILVPMKIEPCELPVGNRRLHFIDLALWDGSPRSPLLDDLLIGIGQRTGTPPRADFLALREYEAAWRRFGALPLSGFALIEPSADSAISADDDSQTGTHTTDHRELGVLHDIWKELRASKNLERLGRFLEQVRGTPLAIAVEERMEQLEGALTSTPTAVWLREARPILERVKEVYEAMAWSQTRPSPDPAFLEANARHLIASLPPVTPDVDVVAVANVLDDYLSTKLHHGVPIPDDYTLESVFPLPGSIWGESRARVKLCVRPGLKSSRYHREGFGDLPEGSIVTPEVVFEQKQD